MKTSHRHKGPSPGQNELSDLQPLGTKVDDSFCIASRIRDIPTGAEIAKCLSSL